MNINYEATILFKYNYASTAHIVINQGGTSSGKTYAIEQVLFCLACQKEKQVITIVGQDIPNLRAGALRDALAIYNGNTNQAGSRDGDGVYRKIRLTRQIYAVTRFIK